MAENRNARLITKRTSVPGKIPTGTTGDESSFIRAGELASNLADHSLWGYDGADVFEYGSNSFLGLTGGTISGDLIIDGNLNVTGDTILQAVSGTSYYVEDYIQFNTGYTGNTVVEGRMYWDENNQTISVGMHNDAFLQLGQETYYLIKNQSGATIENGRVVRAAGTLGTSGRILGQYMIADGSIPQKFTLGVATQDILNGEDGYVTEFGLVRGIDATGSPYGETWSEGDVLWVSTTIEGGLTNVQPTFPNLNIEMALVISTGVTNGSIFVRPNRYPHFHDLQEADWIGGDESNLDIIQWNGSLSAFTLTKTPTLNSISANTVSASTLYSGTTDVETVIRNLITGEDTYITGATLSADTTLILSRNDGVDVTTDLSIQRAISFNAEEFALDTATRVTLTPITISTVRFAGTGQPDVAGIGFTVPDDYKDGGRFSYIWRSSTNSTTLSAKTNYDMYTGDTNNTGSLVTSVESFSISDTPAATANVFIYSPSYTPTTILSPGMKVHLTITRDPGDAGDTLNSDLDMTDFVFTYNALR